MKNFQVRVIDEKIALDERRSHLIAFFESDSFNYVLIEEGRRLKRQQLIMELYSDVLAERIRNFK